MELNSEIRKATDPIYKKISKTTFVYVFIVLLITLIFFSFLLLSLIFFVLFSCYHFGEQQWTILDENIDSGLLFFTNGLLIFATLFYFHRNEVIVIVFITLFYFYCVNTWAG